jgi:hypothetical protein
MSQSPLSCGAFQFGRGPKGEKAPPELAGASLPVSPIWAPLESARIRPNGMDPKTGGGHHAHV